METENIIRVIDIYKAKNANDYLEVGWILLGVTPGYMGCSTEYSLGWDKTKGEIPTEPKEKYELHDDSEDFIAMCERLKNSPENK
jgi:hypothetical protein